MAVHQRRRWIRVRHRRRAPRPPLSWPPGGGTRASPRAHAPRRHRRRDRGVRRSRASALAEPLGRRHHRSVRISRDRALRTGRDHAGVDLRGRGRARREANLMEQGANTTYVRCAVLRARTALVLQLKVLVNYRDSHGATRGDGWRMDVTPVARGVRVIAFDGARPLLLLADHGDATTAHSWYRNFDLAVERARGLEAVEDHLHVATFRASLELGEALTLVLSAEAEPSLDGDAAWSRRAQHDAEVLDTWRRAQPSAEGAPIWIGRLVLAADQFLVRRPLVADLDGMTVISGC